MKSEIEFSANHSLKADGFKKIYCIDNFNTEQRREILLRFFDESTDIKKDLLNECFLDNLLNDSISLLRKILNTGDSIQLEQLLIRSIWIVALSDLEDIFDKASDDSSRDRKRLRMSEMQEHRLFDDRERAADMNQQLQQLRGN